MLLYVDVHFCKLFVNYCKTCLEIIALCLKFIVNYCKFFVNYCVMFIKNSIVLQIVCKLLRPQPGQLPPSAFSREPCWVHVQQRLHPLPPKPVTHLRTLPGPQVRCTKNAAPAAPSIGLTPGSETRARLHSRDGAARCAGHGFDDVADGDGSGD